MADAPTDTAATDRRHMRRALGLAKRGRGRTRPNPMVGAVLVKDGVVVGEGWHRVVGGPHAEIEALRVAGDAARGATMYVTLEPCCHQGRTGPCTRALIEAGVGRVVAAAGDPNPVVAGKGFAELRAAGIPVAEGLLGDDARRLNVGHTSVVTRGRPFVTLKLAATLDGKIAAPDRGSRWISGPASRRIVQRLRGEHDAVAVGSGTALADDPQLTRRDARGRRRGVQPLRVVFDTGLSLPPTARMLTEEGGAVHVVAGVSADAARERGLVAAGARVLRVAEREGRTGRRHVDPAAALVALVSAGVTSVLVEGGSGVGTALLRAGLVDRLALFLAPKIMGGAAAVPLFGWLGVEHMDDVLPLHDVRVRRSGPDIFVTGRPGRGPAATDGGDG